MVEQKQYVYAVAPDETMHAVAGPWPDLAAVPHLRYVARATFLASLKAQGVPKSWWQRVRFLDIRLPAETEHDTYYTPEQIDAEWASWDSERRAEVLAWLEQRDAG